MAQIPTGRPTEPNPLTEGTPSLRHTQTQNLEAGTGQLAGLGLRHPSTTTGAGDTQAQPPDNMELTWL